MEKKQEQKGQKEPTFSPSAIDAIMARVSQSSGSDSEFRKRGCTVTIFPGQCMPGALTEPIKVGVVELDSDEEIRAYRYSGGVQVEVGEDGLAKDTGQASVPQQALAVAFGREAMRTVNGKRLTSDEKRVLWEIIGMTGRVAIGLCYMAHCTGASEGFLERSMASVEVW